MYQGLQFIISMIGCFKAGVIAIPVWPPNLKQANGLDRLKSIVKSSHAKLLIAPESLSTPLSRSMQQAEHHMLHEVTTVEFEQVIVFDNGHAPLKRPTNQKTQIAYLQFTSGSTGEPKGVMITHENLLHNIQCRTRWLPLKQHDVSTSWIPLYHDYGLVAGCMAPLYYGVPIYLITPEAFIQDPLIWIRVMSRYRCTTSYSPNFGYRLLLRAWDELQVNKSQKHEQLDLSCVRMLTNGAEPVREKTLHKIADTFAPFGLKQKVLSPGYGQAEHTLSISIHRSGLQGIETNRGKVSLGKVVRTDDPHTNEIDVRIVHPETCKEVSVGTEGEIWVRSKSVAAGYYNLPQLSREVFHARIQSPHSNCLNYLRTGDVGFVSRTGNLFISGRIKDIIIVRGQNYHAEDIEDAIGQMNSDIMRPGRLAAIAVDNNKTEQVTIVTEVRAGFLVGLQEQDIHEKLEELAHRVYSTCLEKVGIKCDRVVFIPERTLPITSSGKVRRLETIQQFTAGKLKVLFEKLFLASDSGNNNYLNEPHQLDELLARAHQGFDSLDLMRRNSSRGNSNDLATQLASDAQRATVKQYERELDLIGNLKLYCMINIVLWHYARCSYPTEDIACISLKSRGSPFWLATLPKAAGLTSNGMMMLLSGYVGKETLTWKQVYTMMFLSYVPIVLNTLLGNEVDNGPTTNHYWLPTMGSSWFIIAVLLARIISHLATKLMPTKKKATILAAVIGFTISIGSFWLFQGRFRPYITTEFFPNLLYYFLGYALRGRLLIVRLNNWCYSSKMRFMLCASLLGVSIYTAHAANIINHYCSPLLGGYFNTISCFKGWTILQIIVFQVFSYARIIVPLFRKYFSH